MSLNLVGMAGMGISSTSNTFGHSSPCSHCPARALFPQEVVTALRVITLLLLIKDGI